MLEKIELFQSLLKLNLEGLQTTKTTEALFSAFLFLNNEKTD
jgi:hypothetical protein